jgi:Mn2+/Fe2+ NRAMP family transporter
MNKLFEIALGIVTGIGGFLEAGSTATAAQAGAEYGYRLVWAILLGTICLAFLVEMSGRLAAVSKHTLPDAMRERFGIRFFLLPLIPVLLVSFMVLASEIGGVAVALELATGVSFQWWALPVGFCVWLLLWKGTFGMVEKGVSLLGLVTLAFVVGAAKLHPSWSDIGRHLLPSLPDHEPARYWLLVVSILGASVSPYLFYFYSAGVVEDEWDEDYLGVNRVISGAGMGFGGGIAISVLVASAILFHPKGIEIEKFQQLPVLLETPMGRAGFWLFVASLGIACFGAALQLSLQMAYLLAQGFGWRWSEDLKPAKAARFSLVYTLVLPLAALVICTGIEPLKLTLISMVFTALSLPITVVPLLVLMNDPQYMGDHPNGWMSNAAVLFVSVLACLIAVVAIPLQIFGS